MRCRDLLTSSGTLAHSLDFDDTHSAGSVHPSAPGTSPGSPWTSTIRMHILPCSLASDTQRFTHAYRHPGSCWQSFPPVVPAAMAAAEMVGCTGEEFLTGVIAGFAPLRFQPSVATRLQSVSSMAVYSREGRVVPCLTVHALNVFTRCQVRNDLQIGDGSRRDCALSTGISPDGDLRLLV